MKFIIDTQLPPQLAKALLLQGFDTIHTTYFKEGHLLTDKEIIDIATKEDRVIIIKDSDFLDNFLLNGVPPKVLLLDFGNISNQNLKILLEKHFDSLNQLFQKEFSFLVLRENEILTF